MGIMNLSQSICPQWTNGKFKKLRENSGIINSFCDSETLIQVSPVQLFLQLAHLYNSPYTPETKVVQALSSLFLYSSTQNGTLSPLETSYLGLEIQNQKSQSIISGLPYFKILTQPTLIHHWKMTGMLCHQKCSQLSV